tara:strand:+ start:80 stop:433 length:354 start_codon:yes stop_codon:yes gene_type:complete
MKICKQCSEEKLLADFHKAPNNKDGKKSTCKVCDSILRRSDRYGFSYEEIIDMFKSGCMVCGGSEKLHIDHDHNCCPGKYTCGNCVRGTLCQKCNQGIGYLNDDPNLLRLAIRYLEK